MTHSTVMPRAERKAAWAAWRTVPRRDRGEALRLAKQHLPHPDPEVAAVVAQWARTVGRHRRLPPLVLPLVLVVGGPSLAFLPGTGAVARLGLLALAGLGVVLGLLDWNNRILARLVLALPSASVRRPVVTVEVDGLQPGGFGEGTTRD